MQVLGWIFFGIATVIALISYWQQWRARSVLDDRIREAEASAARLPDAVSRAERAEAKASELAGTLEKAIANEATLAAQNVGLRNQVEQVTAASKKYEDMYVTSQATEDELKTAAAKTEATLGIAKQQLADALRERDHAYEQLKEKNVELQRINASLATALAEKNAATELLEQKTKFLQEAQAHLRVAFTEAASKIFDEKSIVLDQRIKDSAEVSRKGFEETLKPFSEKVGAFQTRIEHLSAEQSRERATLVGTIGELKSLNQNMADATGQLTKALKGSAKVRGDWGELILDTVLKASGLEQGQNYERQMQSTDEETGERGRPDVIINLPDGRRVVVDSKVNLLAWTEAQNADTPDSQQEALYRHVTALRQHVKDLSDKNYPKLLGQDALDLTIMFVPIEGALSAALAINSDLQTDAFAKKVVFASPNTLMAMLRVVERLWTRDKLQKQVDTIGIEAGKMMDSLIAFLEEFQVVESRIKQVGDAYTTAKRRLSESSQSVMARGRRLTEAGVRGKRALPEELRPVGAEDALPLIEQNELRP
jgi:DNA recombination protein RmuC